MSAEPGRLNIMAVMMAITSAWSAGLFAARLVFKQSPISILGLIVQVLVIVAVLSSWLAASWLLSRRNSANIGVAANALTTILAPLLLLLLLQSTTINELLGLKRPVLLTLVILLLWTGYRVFDNLGIKRPQFLENGLWFLFLSFLVLSFFWRIILTSPLHTGIIVEDFNLFFPFKKLAAEMIRSGIIPLWNPYAFSGAPLLADSQAAVFHPASLLLTLLAGSGELSYRAAELAVVVQYIIVIIGTFLFARIIGLKAWSAAVAAIVFTFGGFMVSHIRHLPIVNVVVWMPWILWTQEKFIKRKRLGWQVLASIFLLFAFLGGHLQSVLIVFSMAIVYIGWSTYQDTKDSSLEMAGQIAIWIKALLPIPAALMLGAWQVLPTLELLPLSGRAVSVSYHLTTEFSLELQNLITFIAPNFMGGVKGYYWGPWSYWWEFGGYIGIFSLILVAISLMVTKVRHHQFFLVTAGVSLVLALGSNTVLHPILYMLWPGYHLNRSPSRLLLVFTFAGAILCAYGFEQLIEILDKYPEKLVKIRRGVIFLIVGLAAFVPFLYLGFIDARNRDIYEYFSTSLNAVVWAILLAVASLAFFIERKAKQLGDSKIKILIVAFIIFDLFSSWQNWFVEEKSPETCYTADAAVDYIRSDPGVFRVDNREVWPPNAGCAYRIQTIGGSNTLSLAGYDRISGLYELLNIKYVVAKGDVDEPGFMKIRAFDDVSVYKNENVTPRAVMAGSAKIISNREEIFNKVNSREFSINEVVYLEDQSLKEKVEQIDDREDIDSKIDITVYEPNCMRLKVNNSQPGFLVLSEMYYPGWTAKVDGKGTNIYRADYALRAIWLDKGIHRVDFEYRPDSFYKGLNISLITAIVLMLGLAGEVLIRRRQARKSQ